MSNASPGRDSGVSKEHAVAPGTEATGACGETGLDLVTSNLGFVAKIAGKYRNLGLPFEDLLNEGILGLIEAARRFDPARGVKFLSYAMWWIRRSMLNAISQNASLVRIPQYQLKQARNVRDTRRMLARALGREAGSEEISRDLRLSVARVDRILQAQMRDRSLHDTVGKDRDITFLEQLADDSYVSPEEEMIRRQNRVLLRQALRHLSGRQLSVIIDRFGLAGGRALTLKEIGDRLGMTRENVRQIETKATKRLRKVMTRRAAAGRRPQRARPHGNAWTHSIGEIRADRQAGVGRRVVVDDDHHGWPEDWLDEGERDPALRIDRQGVRLGPGNEWRAEERPQSDRPGVGPRLSGDQQAHSSVVARVHVEPGGLARGHDDALGDRNKLRQTDHGQGGGLLCVRRDNGQSETTHSEQGANNPS